MSPPDHTDVQAAENFMVFQYAWIADPLYFGDYPLVRGEGGGRTEQRTSQYSYGSTHKLTRV